MASDLVPIPEDEPDENSSPNPELFRRMLENQAEEITLRRQEVDLKREEMGLRHEELRLGHEYATQLLKAQVLDRDKDREANKASSNTGCVLFVVTFLILTGGIGWALAHDKDALVLEVLKALIFVGSGGAAGYGARSAKADKNEPPPE